MNAPIQEVDDVRSRPWFEELLYPDIRQSFRSEKTLVDTVTKIGHRIKIFETIRFGLISTLDGIVQCIQADEYIYHELLAHVPLCVLPQGSRVLIIGGASGAMAREVLRHNVSEVHMVDIDEEFVLTCRTQLVEIHQGAFFDRRLTLHFAEANEWLARSKPLFDLIIVDSPDPVGPATSLFSANFYEACANSLNSHGILVCQTGVPFLQEDELTKVTKSLAKLFPRVGCFRAATATCNGGDMTFAWASRGPDIANLDNEEIVRAKEVSTYTKYYCPQIHLAAFVVPKTIRRLCNYRP